jgi:hypothetical protein
MDGDLASQVRVGLGEAVRSLGNATHDRLSLLRAAPSLQRSCLAFLIGASPSLMLSRELVGCLSDPFPSAGAVT